MEKKKTFASYMPLTFLIGFGFFTMGMMDPLYDSYVQIFLSRYIPYKWIIGLIMSLDNLLALFLIPIVSVWSDRTDTPLGRRMPWIITLLPLSAICFAFIPYAAEQSLLNLILLLLVLNLLKQSVRGPVVALMPDIIPGTYRSQANGVINTMGNIAAIVGTLFLARLMDVDIILPVLGSTKNRLAFPAGSAFVLLAVIALVIFVREKKQRSLDEYASGTGPTAIPDERISVLKSVKMVFTAPDKSAFLVLLSIFLWFTGYQGVVPYITEYSIKTFNLTTGEGPFAMGMVGIASALSAIPMGYAASKWGRKRLIRLSLALLSVIVLCAFLLVPVANLTGMSAGTLKIAFWALMFLFGVFWISIIANSFPMLWQMASYRNIGLYTGLYYTFSQLAAIVAPSLSGLLIDVSSFSSMFVFCALFFILANITMSFVTKGEKNDSSLEVRP